MKILFGLNLFLLVAGILLGDVVQILLCVMALSTALIQWQEEKDERETFEA
ncbi:hypothetical protein NUH87_28595 [Pseudomonas batumici]|uniref:hypothetical protein n=1 Tax=Pseudomonas batumici TaxID=226910 RepID=UPI0030CB0CF7